MKKISEIKEIIVILVSGGHTATKEFYDKTLFRQFIGSLSGSGILVEDEHGKLNFDQTLETIAEGARLVMSTELRHGILQVASGSN